MTGGQYYITLRIRDLPENGKFHCKLAYSGSDKNTSLAQQAYHAVCKLQIRNVL
jgi:hypothetical protein